MRRAAKVDRNHVEVVEALRAIGCLVRSTAAVGQGFPDLCVLSPFTSQIHLIEVKDGAKPPSARRLTPDEQTFADTWGVVQVITSVDEAIAAVRTIPQVRE